MKSTAAILSHQDNFGEFTSKAGGRGMSKALVLFCSLTSSLKKGAGRSWCSVCILVFIIFCIAGQAMAVAPGTLISNTAQAEYGNWGTAVTGYSNTVAFTTGRLTTHAQIEFLQYAPTVTGATHVQVPATEYSNTGNTASSVTITALYPAGSTIPINLAVPVPLISASVFHQNEPIFVRVVDMDQNLYPSAAETIWVLVTVPGTGDEELLLLTETDDDTGIFVGYVQSGNLGTGSVNDFNGLLDVNEGGQIEARYTDAADATDTVATAALVDPYGLVFDSVTGMPVNNVQLTLVVEATGAPASVWGDDGVSAFPSTITSGGTFVDGSGKVYAFAPGHYRFPYVSPGTYRLEVTPATGYAAPSTVPTAILQALPGSPFAVVDPGSRGEAFVLNPGPAIRMDIPVDPAASGLWLQKRANREAAAIGDFVQYAITVENHSGGPASGVIVTDDLPLGFVYRKGSFQMDGMEQADPRISSDGRSLTFSMGDMAADALTRITYVAEIAAGTSPGKAENRAAATAGGGLLSNSAVAAVMVKEDFFRSKNFIMGRVVADNCNDMPTERVDGVSGVRIYLEDGTYVITDEQGRYHFEGVSSGTHVVQLDLDTLPDLYEMAQCDEDSRKAGTPFSRFVELHGGTLWRADFHVRTQNPPSGHARLQLTCGLEEKTIDYRAQVHVESVDIDNLRLTVILPQGGEYVPGSSKNALGGKEDPQVRGNVLIYRLGAAAAGLADGLDFKARLNGDALPGQLHTQAMLTFNTPGQKNQRTELIDTVLSLKRRKIGHVQPPVVVRPHFDSLSADLTAKDRRLLDRLVKRLEDSEIEHVVCVGHTDNRLIRPGRKHPFIDNRDLSRIRARNVAAYLAERLNIPEHRMTVVGKGATQPISNNANQHGRADNRRVEVRVMTVKNIWQQDITAVKSEDSATADTMGGHMVDTAVSDSAEGTSANGQDTTRINMESLSQGFDMLMPESGFYPQASGLKLAFQHGMSDRIILLRNGQAVSPFNFQGLRFNKSRTVAVSLWRGVDLKEGDNHFIAICKDQKGVEKGRIERTIHYSGPPVKAELISKDSRLIANGKDAAVIAVRFTDKDGHPARKGIFGEYRVHPPHKAYAPPHQKGGNFLLADAKTTFIIGDNGIALLKLEPTSQPGHATVTIPMSHQDEEIRVWLQPQLRDWILVGLAEGTIGHNAISGNMENLKAGDREDNFYRDGRIAFFAKGKVKGKWLLTAAYDSGREREDIETGLFQAIDPDTYYTLYGDAARQQNEAASTRKLFLKIERQQFYALFGDYDTGLSVTELSQYNRRFNGVKSEYMGDRWGFTAFASDTDQAFIKDEIRGDGSSGLYRLSRKNIVPNSETVTIETRDRYRSEIIVSSKKLSRHIDYNIDAVAGTLFFKSPVYSRDEHFNPTYIVVDYESQDRAEASYTYGGRGRVMLSDGKVELGATYIHEGQGRKGADMGGLDAKITLGQGVEARMEVAATRKDALGGKQNSQAYLAQLSKQTERLDAKAYYREQGEGFGLGQQNGSEEATRKLGADAAWRVNDQWQLTGELFRQYNLATDAERDLAEAQVSYRQTSYDLYSGLRLTEDRLGNNADHRSTQLLVGASKRFIDNRLQTRISHEQSLASGDSGSDFPTRTIIGADYKITDPVTVFAEHEVARGGSEISQSSRLGLKATPWQGGQVGSALGEQYTENGRRLFANLGLTQSWHINERWSVDGGLDRTQTMDRDEERAAFNANVPYAAGAEEDFTAISFGASYRAQDWSWTGRMESRMADSEDKRGLITGIAGEVRPGLGLSAGAQVFSTQTTAGADSLDGHARLSLAYRPKNTRWIVLDRLDYIFENRNDGDGQSRSRRFVNNLNANYQPHRRFQVGLQYGAKYVLDTFDSLDYSGFTDLTGIEARYDLTRRWDVGLYASVLHSWNAGQLDYRTGCSVGYAMMKNMWVSLGYNFTGFKDEDFSAADFTAAGPFIKMRLKFDQQSVKEMVNWFD